MCVSTLRCFVGATRWRHSRLKVKRARRTSHNIWYYTYLTCRYSHLTCRYSHLRVIRTAAAVYQVEGRKVPGNMVTRKRVQGVRSLTRGERNDRCRRSNILGANSRLASGKSSMLEENSPDAASMYVHTWFF